MLRVIVGSVLTSMLLAMPANAVIIDLTPFSNSDSPTHSHIYENKYDNDYHWQECKLCKDVANKVAHDKKTIYTIGEVSCSVSNKKVEQCSSPNCGYFSQVTWTNKEHTRGSLTSIGDSRTPNGIAFGYAVYRCTECNAAFDESPFYDSEGNLIDWDTVQLPIRAYHRDGNYVSVRELRQYTGNEIVPVVEWRVTHSADKSTLDIVLVLDMKDAVLEQYHSEEQLTDPNYVASLFSYYQYINGSTKYSILSTGNGYDPVTKKYTMSYSAPLRDLNGDYTSPIRIEPQVRSYTRMSGNGSIFRIYSPGTSYYFYTNFEEPVISEVTCS